MSDLELGAFWKIYTLLIFAVSWDTAIASTVGIFLGICSLLCVVSNDLPKLLSLLHRSLASQGQQSPWFVENTFAIAKCRLERRNYCQLPASNWALNTLSFSIWMHESRASRLLADGVFVTALIAFVVSGTMLSLFSTILMIVATLTSLAQALDVVVRLGLLMGIKDDDFRGLLIKNRALNCK